MRSNQKVEARYFEAFREARPDLPLGDFEHRDKPDFLGRIGHTQVGIEVTRYSPEKKDGLPVQNEQEGLQHQTMSLARNAYEARGGRPMHVLVVFRHYPALTKKRTRELSRELADFVLGSPHRFIEYRRSGLDDMTGGRFLPEVEKLSAYRAPAEESSTWHAGGLGWPLHAHAEDICRTVLAKASKTKAYRVVCDEIWLLVVFDRLNAEFEVRPPTAPVGFAVPTDFDRIFCLDPTRSVCVEVPVIRA
ncbi:MAG TPA: hypothetical protein VFR37_04195 [Longimicrobium sp.]|nr:hypothetical protein [Longimicrobium sp.]